MLKKLTLLAGLLVSFHAASTDTVVSGKIWTVEYNTASAFYSAAKGEQEITMECLLGDMTFASNDDETGEDFNSHDDKMFIVVDGIAYKPPVTLQERAKLYNTVLHASDSIQYRTASGLESKAYPVKELRQFFQSIEFDLSDCKE
mgnify:CR=1 FL=1